MTTTLGRARAWRAASLLLISLSACTPSISGGGLDGGDATGSDGGGRDASSATERDASTPTDGGSRDDDASTSTPVVDVPARIEAEAYVRFFDTTPGNQGAACRDDDVDLQAGASDGACHVGWTQPGEWLEYDIRSTGGELDISLRVASERAGMQVHVELDGVSVGTVSVPADGWQSFADRTIRRVTIEPGVHVLRVVFDTGSTNLDYLVVAEASEDPDPTGELLYRQDFEAERLGTGFAGEQLAEVREGCGVGGGRCVRVTYQPSSDGSQRITGNLPIPTTLDATLSYDVFFENGFEFVKGGKIPGLGPTQPTTGCAAIADQGWSNRLMWRRGGEPVIYAYHQDRVNRCGDDVESGEAFAIGRYHALSLHVVLNTPAAQSNGLVELYLDGQLIARRSGLRIRGSDAAGTEITRILFHTFHGGSDSTWSPSRPVHARFDNFTIHRGLHVRRAPGSD